MEEPFHPRWVSFANEAHRVDDAQPKCVHSNRPTQTPFLCDADPWSAADAPSAFGRNRDPDQEGQRGRPRTCSRMKPAASRPTRSPHAH
jgi:hypothetical protein